MYIRLSEKKKDIYIIILNDEGEEMLKFLIGIDSYNVGGWASNLFLIGTELENSTSFKCYAIQLGHYLVAARTETDYGDWIDTTVKIENVKTSSYSTFIFSPDGIKSINEDLKFNIIAGSIVDIKLPDLESNEFLYYTRV